MSIELIVGNIDEFQINIIINKNEAIQLKKLFENEKEEKYEEIAFNSFRVPNTDFYIYRKNTKFYIEQHIKGNSTIINISKYANEILNLL